MVSRPLFWFGIHALLFVGGWCSWRFYAVPEDAISPVFGSILFAMALMLPALLAMSVFPRIKATKLVLWVIVLSALCTRLLLLGVDPFLSDDLYRYLWEGEVQREGHDPYRAAPSSSALDGVAQDEHWQQIRLRVNHPDVPTVYPPLSQLLFRVFASTEFGWRFLMLLFDMLVGTVIALALSRRGLDARRAILWWWHPLPILECAVGGHPEVFAVFLVTVAMVLLTENRGRIASVVIGAAIAAKLLPIGWVPLLVRRVGSQVWLPLLGTIFLASLPFLGSDLLLASRGFREFGSSWYSGDLLFRPLGQLLGLDPENRFSEGAQWLRGVLFAAWLLIAWRCRALPPWRAFLIVGFAFTLLTPVLHPWYLLWLLPAAILENSKASLLLTWTILFQYQVLDDWRALGVWEMPYGTRVLVFGIPLLLIIWHCWRERFARVSIPG